MKSEEDIEKQIEDAKNQLVAATDEKNVAYLQGYVQALNWITAKEEKEKPKTEEVTD